MEALTCKCCGAPVNRSTMKCEYCGTQYKIDNSGEVIRIETFQNPCHVLKCQMSMPEYDIKSIGLDKAADIACKQLARQMSESLIPFLDIHEEYDPMSMSVIITAKCRLVEPKYRF